MEKKKPGARARRRWILCIAGAPVAALGLLTVLHFPFGVDAALSAEELEKTRDYYAKAYKQESAEKSGPASEYETRYLKIATEAAERFKITDQVERFVRDYDLRDRPVIEIGSGRGYLQDHANDYTGLDISSSVSRFYHKKFVLGSATAMPFADNSFEGGWSIWVLEHVPNPEQALRELRRVMKNNAVFFLLPAWNCNGWAAQGYGVRPYADFGLGGKLMKASARVRSTAPYLVASLVPVRLLRREAARFGPTRLRYHRLEPNYEQYWEADADAVNGIDRFEAMLWFQSRGDECLNCTELDGSVFMGYNALIIRIRK